MYYLKKLFGKKEVARPSSESIELNQYHGNNQHLVDQVEGGNNQQQLNINNGPGSTQIQTDKLIAQNLNENQKFIDKVTRGQDQINNTPGNLVKQPKSIGQQMQEKTDQLMAQDLHENENFINNVTKGRAKLNVTPGKPVNQQQLSKQELKDKNDGVELVYGNDQNNKPPENTTVVTRKGSSIVSNDSEANFLEEEWNNNDKLAQKKDQFKVKLQNQLQKQKLETVNPHTQSLESDIIKQNKNNQDKQLQADIDKGIQKHEKQLKQAANNGQRNRSDSEQSINL